MSVTEQQECDYCGQSVEDYERNDCINDRECSACEVSHNWFYELREANLPHRGCTHCDNPPLLWCFQCEAPEVACDDMEVTCTCAKPESKSDSNNREIAT